MTINTTTIEASLQSVLDATSSSTTTKDMLLLSKTIEAYNAATAASEAASFSQDYILAENMAANSVAVINSLGKVEAVSGTAAVTASLYENTSYVMSGNNASVRGHIDADPLNNNRFAVVQVSGSGSWVTVATLSGTTITWGTPLLLKSGGFNNGTPRVSWDPHTASGRLVVQTTLYAGGSPTIYLSIVTVSGTTCTKESEKVESAGAWNFGDVHWLPSIADRIVFTARDSKRLQMSNVSATHQITFNSHVFYDCLDQNPGVMQFFPDDGTKAVLLYGSSGGVAVRIATFSSSAITLGALQVITGAQANGTQTRHSAIAFPHNDSSKVVFASEGIISYNQYTAVAATRSGDTFTFGALLLIDIGGDDSAADSLITFNPDDSTNVLVSTNENATASKLQVLTLAGTTLTKQGNIISTDGHGYTSNLGNSGKFVMWRYSTGSAHISSYGVAGTTNVTAGKVAGLLTAVGTTGQTKKVQFAGRLDGFTGLTIGAEYYAQPTGGISTSSTGAVLIGFAASATTIQIK
jgi:hypothetical protein